MINIIKWIFLFFLSFYNLVWEKPKPGNYNNGIKCIKVSENFPMIDSKGKLVRYDTFFVKIYYYKNLVMQKTEYQFDSSLNGELVQSERRYSHLVWEKGKELGVDYDLNKPDYKMVTSVDSVLKHQWFTNIELYSTMLNNTATLVSSHKSNDGILEEYFSLKGKKDTSMSGSILLSFTDKLKDIDFSLSKELDSVKRMKLFKVKIVDNPRYMKQYGITIDRIESTYDLEEVPVINQKEVLNYFETFLKDSRTLLLK